MFLLTCQGPYTFEIGDTSKFGQYEKGGFMEQIKVPFQTEFKPLSNFFGTKPDPNAILLSDWSKFDRPTKYHSYVQGLLAFREAKGRFPTPGSSVHIRSPHPSSVIQQCKG